jgi:hypothetical protein
VNKNVWIVFSDIDDTIHFDGVFSSKEKAEAMHKEFMYIEEQELDVMDIA